MVTRRMGTTTPHSRIHQNQPTTRSTHPHHHRLDQLVGRPRIKSTPIHATRPRHRPWLPLRTTHRPNVRRRNHRRLEHQQKHRLQNSSRHALSQFVRVRTSATSRRATSSASMYVPPFRASTHKKFPPFLTAFPDPSEHFCPSHWPGSSGSPSRHSCSSRAQVAFDSFAG